MTLADFGTKVLKYFISNSEEKETILFVLDNETYQSFFSDIEEKDIFEEKLRLHVYNKGLAFDKEETAIALAAHQSLLAYEKIKRYLKEDTDRAINDAISSFFGFRNNQIYDYYYHRNSKNDNHLLWKAVQNKFATFSRIISLPATGYEYQKYPNEQIKFYRIFKNDDFNNLFSRWLNSDIVTINQIYNDSYCGELLEQYFLDPNYQTIVPILWTYYSSWKRNIKVSENDNHLYIELYDEKKIFKIAGDVFNRKRNHINNNSKRFYKVFEHDSGNWWRGTNDNIPSDREFVLLIDKKFEDKFSNTNPIKYDFIDDDCEFIVYKYNKRPTNFNTDFPLVPQLIGGVRLRNNQYLDIPWLLPINKDGLNYTKISPTNNIDESLASIWNDIDGLRIISSGNPKFYSNIDETETDVFEERSTFNNTITNDKLTEQEIAVLECQQALFLWLATKGKASHSSIHNICLNLIENYECLENIENDYPEYFIFQPLFKAGIIELYKNEEGKYYYALAKGGNFTNSEHFSYWKYNNSDVTTTQNIECYLDKLPSLENVCYVFKDLFEPCSIENNVSAFIRYSTNYSWSYGVYETTIEKIRKHPSIFKTSNIVYMPTYFNDSNGRIFKLKDDFANPWYPVSWNFCESYIDLKKGKNLFIYIKNEKKLVCKDITAIPLFIVRALISNDHEKLRTPSFWLSYFNPKYKMQVFNNVNDSIYKILKRNYLLKRDEESILIKTNQKEKTFSFKGKEYQLPTKESFRIFRFRVEENFNCWQSDIDTNEIPINRPFGLLIDTAYGSGYISLTDTKVYESDQNSKSRPMTFIVYNRKPADFFEKLQHYEIKESPDKNYLLELPTSKRQKLNVKLIDGLTPDYRIINNNLLDYSNKEFTYEINEQHELILVDEKDIKINAFFGKWINNLNFIHSVNKIQNVEILPYDIEKNTYEIISFKIADTRAIVTKVPLAGNKEKWETLLNEGKNPWETLGYSKALIKQKSLIGKIIKKPFTNIKIDTIDRYRRRFTNTDFDSVFILQDRLYEWLGNEIGYATIAEIHEFLMRELEKYSDYEFYGINPESKIFRPLLYCGVIDARNAKDEEYICYTISKKKKLLKLQTDNFIYDYQFHFSDGNTENLDYEDILIYYLSLLNDKDFCSRKIDFKKIEFIFDENSNILYCSNIHKIPWQLVRLLIMMDVQKMSEIETYLLGCKEYKSIYFTISNIKYLYFIDNLITLIKK